MKTAGIIGGIGPESTMEYYRSFMRTYRTNKNDRSSPPIIIDSIDLMTMMGMVEAGELGKLTDYLLEEVQKLALAGSDFALLAGNTPHIVFDALQRRSPIPLISIVESASLAVRALGLTTVGLFGTRFTMQEDFYASEFTRQGIALVVPGMDDQDYIHEKYMGELVNGVFLPETHDQMLRIAGDLIRKRGIQGLV